MESCDTMSIGVIICLFLKQIITPIVEPVVKIMAQLCFPNSAPLTTTHHSRTIFTVKVVG